jgi:pimeloyl-ACP methyl ester carboxylesterase
MVFLGLHDRLPTLKEAAKGLGTFLDPFFGDANGDKYIDITLVGHSMGGLVIQSWLVHELQHKRDARSNRSDK